MVFCSNIEITQSQTDFKFSVWKLTDSWDMLRVWGVRSGDTVIVQKHGNGALIEYVHKLEDNAKVDLRKCVGFNNME